MRIFMALLAFLSACTTQTKEEPSNLMNPHPGYLKKGDSRTFQIRYTGTVTGVPEGTETLRVWIPVPQDTSVQKISNLTLEGPTKEKQTIEKKYGNRMAYFEIEKPRDKNTFTMTFTVTRSELIVDLDQLQEDGKGKKNDLYLKPSTLVVIDDRIRKMATDITRGKSTTLEKTRAIYDYVLGHMSYDKSGTGWGLGSTQHACEVGKGNCTDFHSLFNSLCRAEGIESGFEIGLFPGYDKKKKSGKPGGYHCWALFRVPGKTWVPVDISESSKKNDPDGFFGRQTSNRVTLSTGRDITLNPPQKGAPLNYFLDPYAEADGKSVPTSKTWDYEEK